MNREQIKDAIIQKQDEIIQLLSYNDAFFNVRIAVLNEEVTELKADLKNKLEECGKYKAIKVDTGGENNCNNCIWGKCLTKDWPCNDCKWGKCLTKDWPCNDCKWGICLTKDWPCNDCNGRNKWEPIKTE